MLRTVAATAAGVLLRPMAALAGVLRRPVATVVALAGALRRPMAAAAALAGALRSPMGVQAVVRLRPVVAVAALAGALRRPMAAAAALAGTLRRPMAALAGVLRRPVAALAGALRRPVAALAGALRRPMGVQAVVLLRPVVAVAALAGALTAAGPETVVIDSDSCLFCDDGAAVTMLLRSPAQVMVAGVTIVAGNVWTAQGAEYMLHVLDLLKRPGTPLFLGAAQPLIHTAAMAKEYGRRWGPLEYSGAFGLNPAEVKPAPGPHSERPPRARRESAVEFLIAEIERHPGEVTILEIGPMTDLALALSLRPDIEGKIKRLVFMGGTLRAPGNASSLAEFNFWFDPEAARIVLRSRIPKKVMFGLDICNLAPLSKAEFDQIAGARTPITDLFREDLGKRYPGFLLHPNATAYMWDALAAAWLIDPGFVTKSEVDYLDVLTAWGKFYGSTVPLDRRVAPDATPVQVMLGLDFRRVFGLYRELLTRRD